MAELYYARMKAFLVIREIRYEGLIVEGCFFDQGRAFELRDTLANKNRSIDTSYCVEAWGDGALEGEEIVSTTKSPA